MWAHNASWPICLQNQRHRTLVKKYSTARRSAVHRDFIVSGSIARLPLGKFIFLLFDAPHQIHNLSALTVAIPALSATSWKGPEPWRSGPAPCSVESAGEQFMGLRGLIRSAGSFKKHPRTGICAKKAVRLL